MQKLFALKNALSAAKLFNPEALFHRAENGTVEWVKGQDGPDLLLYRHTYQAVIELEAVAGDLRDVLAVAAIWMKGNADDDDIGPEWSGEPVDRHHSDMELRFTFTEEVHYIPAEPDYQGKDKITLDSVAWKRGTDTADTAVTLTGVEVIPP